MRSEGRVRFVTIGSYTQMAATSALSIAMIWGAVTSYHYLTRDKVLEAKNRTINTMSAQYEALSNDFSALEVEVERKAEQLETRQKFLEEMIGVDAVDVPASEVDESTETADTPKTSAASFTVEQDNSILGELFGAGTAQAAIVSNTDRRKNLLDRLKETDTRQQRVVKKLLNEAESKIATIDNVLAPVSLTNEELLKKSRKHLETLATGSAPVAELEPVFDLQDQRLFLDLISTRQRLDMVTMVLNSFPVGKPAEDYYLSERFGYRIHPVTKAPDNHSGVDLAGWPGTAIYATAPGKVVRAGWFGAYGNMVEIDHGNGFRTRYGHMRKVRVKKGDEVDLGQRVGDMGKTGRVTGTHLHYEVWFDGKVHDPMPFMKAANDVLEIQGRHEETSQQ